MPTAALVVAALLAAVPGCLPAGWIVPVGPCPLVLSGDCPDPNVRFYLYASPDERLQVDGSDGWANLSHPAFDPSLPNKVVVHGYNSGMDIGPLVAIREAYLSLGDSNVFSVDWTALSPGPCYPTAAYNARFAGRCVAGLVRALAARGATDTHLVGFSVGAHVTAFAANALRPFRIMRITGLDPALPLFVTRNPDHKLDKSDAIYVDVLHTNAFVQGKVEPCGHADFYMNGGFNQPGCAESESLFNCDHHRAPEYFAESIRGGRDGGAAGFWGWRCGGIPLFLLGLCPPRGQEVLMGEFSDVREQGWFIVPTASSSPFALGRWQSARDQYQYHHHQHNVQQDNCTESSALLQALLGERELDFVI